MTTSASQTMSRSTVSRPLIGRIGWGGGLLIGLLFIWFHSEFLWRTLLFAYHDKNWSHAILVPLISGYFIFLNRHRLSFAPIERITSASRRLWLWLGLAVIVAGVGAATLGLWSGMALLGKVILAGGLLLLGLGAMGLLAWALFLPAVVRSCWQPVVTRLGFTTRPEEWLRVLGLGLMIFSLLLYVLALYPISNTMARGYSMILGLFGLCLFLAGPRAMAVLWLPVVYLVFAVKISDRLWSQVAQQLQDVAAFGATLTLQCFAAVMNFDVSSSGNQITLAFMRAGEYVKEPINIAEACSGLRMLMAFIALGTALAFIWERRWWQRLTIILATLPIAVLVNIGRVTIIGLLYLLNKDLARGETHIFVGMLMLLPAAALLLGVGWVLDRIIIEEPDQPAPREASGAGAPRSTAASEHESMDAMVSRRLAAGGRADLGRLGRSAQFLKRWAHGLSPAGRGLLIGGGLTLGAGLVYVLTLVTFRPDLVGGWLSPRVAGPLLGLTLLGVVLGIVIVPRLLPRGGAMNPRNRMMSMGVVISALLVASLGQQGLLGMTRAVLFKHPLPLRKPLALIPDTVSSWESRGEDQMLPAAQEEALGTQKYLIRNYVDQDWPQNKPGRIARLHVAYYTGKINTVPHVPDRCFVAGGLQPLNTRTVPLTLSGEHFRRQGGDLLAPSQLLAAADRYEGPARIPARRIPATIFKFATPGRGTNEPQASNVLYFFAANGTFMAGPDQVRLEGWDLRDKYAYYAKIEVSWPGVSDQQFAQQRTQALLSELMPEIMACLPDWQAVQQGRYPPEPAEQRSESSIR